MDNWIIDVLVVLVIILTGTIIFITIRLNNLEISAASMQSRNNILDFSLSRMETKVTLLEDDFDEFIQKHHPELWVKFGIKNWKDRKAYEAVCRKINIALKVDSSDAQAQLSEMSFKMDELCRFNKEFSKGIKEWLNSDPTQLDKDKLRDISGERESADEPIDYRHQITVAKRYFSTVKTSFIDPKHPTKREILSCQTVIEILDMVMDGILIQWIEKKYKGEYLDYPKINTGKDAIHG